MNYLISGGSHPRWRFGEDPILLICVLPARARNPVYVTGKDPRRKRVIGSYVTGILSKSNKITLIYEEVSNMERSLRIESYRNIGFKDEKPHRERLVINNSLNKGELGDLIILIGANNAGK